MTERRPLYLKVLGLSFWLGTIVGCTTMKDLKPAFDANKTNIEELSSNVNSLVQQLRPLAAAAWDAEIESRRTAVLKELQSIGAPHKANIATFTSAQLNAELAADADYPRVTSALSVAAGDPVQIDSIQLSHPVFSALQSMRVTPDAVVQHVTLLYQSRGNIAAIRKQLTDPYPAVSRAVAQKAESLKKIDDYAAALQKQSALAKGHADLFAFASASNANVVKAFSTMISDQGLQGQVLGLIKDERWKTSASESFSLVKDLLEGEASKEAGKNN